MPVIRLAVALAILLTAQAACGMDWRIAQAMPNDPNTVVVMARGAIEPAEGQIFDRFFSRGIEKPGLSIAAVVLVSPGGSVKGASDLADRVSRLRLPTATLGLQPCASACVVIWASGSPRYAPTEDGCLGVHAASRADHTETTVESDAMNDAIADKLKLLGAPPSVLGKLLSTPPSEVGWLDKAEIYRWTTFDTYNPPWGNPIGKVFLKMSEHLDNEVKCIKD
jgi:hypothetical protein